MTDTIIPEQQTQLGCYPAQHFGNLPSMEQLLAFSGQNSPQVLAQGKVIVILPSFLEEKWI
jgi:hypothetical protein